MPGLTEQKMNMFRHDNIAANKEAIFRRVLSNAISNWCGRTVYPIGGVSGNN